MYREMTILPDPRIRYYTAGVLAPGRQPALCKGLTTKNYLQNCRNKGVFLKCAEILSTRLFENVEN
jgi:hypothetical protein